ncbi:MAG: efflux RND transporter permease subunit [Holophagales bacterium]|nr:efflux RND transporter permease subunit [Holophagales bacterium]MYG32000.1 efflux RND transporter permease subunit [Holophagales bacterium]MYI80418.1 efflux RND transporter permease subunit [Holophagales bacterium]
MNLAEFSIRNRLLSVIVVAVVLVGGWNAYRTMARFEDPEFTIRQAVVYTNYPGAAPRQVAAEVTESLETAIQQLPEVEKVTSVSSAGVSEISVEVKYEFSRSPADLEVIWTKLRNKIRDASRNLPPGAAEPIINDDFGDVFGIYYLLTGDGYSLGELKDYARALQRDLLQVPGVAKVALAGVQPEAIHVEISRERMRTLGLSVNAIYSALGEQNTTVAAGSVLVDGRRLVIQPSAPIDSVAEIENLFVSTAASGGLIRLGDVASVSRDYRTPPRQIVRSNGRPAIAVGVSALAGSNVVEVGDAVDAKIAATLELRPLGMSLDEFYHQGKVVEASVDNFVDNVIAAVVIVFVTLLLFMGLRSGVVIGGVLLLIIAATVWTMDLAGIPMHRISLGALIIALGMMVDNAIVVTDGILVGVQRGRRRLDAARDIVDRSRWPLLGGTLVGIIAFAPIGFAPGSTAEFTGDLFRVILISLLYSWIFALTLTPLLCHWLLPEGARAAAKVQARRSPIEVYKRLLRSALRTRWRVVAGVAFLFLGAVAAFQFVTPGFFPASTTPQMVVDFWLPEGVDIARTTEHIVELESFVQELPGVEAVQTLVGAGALRYMLVYAPQSASASYGQLLVRLDDHRSFDGLMPEIAGFIERRYPDAQAKIWRFVLGPGGGSKIEAVFKGPDPAVLRRLADQAKEIMIADGRALSIQDDWRQRVSAVEAAYSEERGRRAGVSRQDFARALETNFTGRNVGVYVEGEELIPIVVRAPAGERARVADIENVQVLSSSTGAVVPIGQVGDGFRTVWRDARIRRENRVPTIQAQCDPMPGQFASDLFARLRPQIEAIELPPGYTLEWGGEYGDSRDSNEDLASTLPVGFAAMVLTVVVLFGALRQPLVIWLVVPLALVGVVVGLVVTGTPMEFMAILGLLSLSGLLIKNAIVLVEKMDSETAAATSRFESVIEAASTRVRPVMLGTLTTILGVIPLFFDAFFRSMAVVLVFGLTFATLLTLVVVPVFYVLFFRINEEKPDASTA